MQETAGEGVNDIRDIEKTIDLIIRDFDLYLDDLVDGNGEVDEIEKYLEEMDQYGRD